MSRRRPRLRLLRLRLPVLLALAGWGALLSLESWIRPAGFRDAASGGAASAFPQQLERQGLIYRRLPGAVPLAQPHASLPGDVVLLEGADYRPTAPGSPPIRLRRVAHSRSGDSGVLPVEAITATFAGPGGTGQCVRLDAHGAITAAFASGWELREAIRNRPVPLHERLAWLAGLRPYRANTCLWEGTPGGSSSTQPRGPQGPGSM